jgi:hypothetical protein
MTSDSTMGTLEVANTLVGLWRAGKLLEAGERFWDENVVSIEPFQGDMGRLQDKASVLGKGKWWLVPTTSIPS